MSLPSLCFPCSVGDHDKHNRDHGIRPGLIGGTYCPCEGNCADRMQDKKTIHDYIQENFDRRG